MNFLKFLLWTCFSVGLGIFLATYEVDGRTPLQQVQRVWQREVKPAKFSAVRQGVEDAFQEARGGASGRKLPRNPPKEHVTQEDRAEVERLIAGKRR